MSDVLEIIRRTNSGLTLGSAGISLARTGMSASLSTIVTAKSSIAIGVAKTGGWVGFLVGAFSPVVGLLVGLFVG